MVERARESILLPNEPRIVVDQKQLALTQMFLLANGEQIMAFFREVRDQLDPFSSRRKPFKFG